METTNKQEKIKLTETELETFVNYVDSFYNEKTGVYRLKNVDKELVKQAVEIYIALDEEDRYPWGNGDSVDRENIRWILETRFRAEEIKAKKQINTTQNYNAIEKRLYDQIMNAKNNTKI